MPTYEYQCNKCGKEFDIFQSIKDKPLSECPECGGDMIKLLSTGSGLIFKGSGFYITDYKNKSGAGESEKSGDKSSDAQKSKPDNASAQTTNKAESGKSKPAAATGTESKK